MTQGSQITTGPQGTLARYHWHQASIVEFHQSVHGLWLDSAVSTDQAAHLEQQHPTHNLWWQRLSQPRCMAAQNVFLQLVQLVLSDPHIGELPKTCIDPINCSARSDHLH